MKPALIAIDMHRGHLDPQVATMPLPPEKARALIDRASTAFERLRGLGIPIIHVVTSYRNPEEIASNPFWRARAEDPSSTRREVLKHNMEGSPGTQIIPELYRDTDYLVRGKKRYSCFLGTDLDLLLTWLKVDALLLAGVNTNSCVLATACDACNRDYRVFVLSDLTDTMDGEERHKAALNLIATAFGWVVESERLMEYL